MSEKRIPQWTLSRSKKCKLSSPSTLGVQNPFGEAIVLRFCTCHRHVPREFINSVIASKRLVRSGPGRCHLTQFNDWNIAKSSASYSVRRATCDCRVAGVLTLLLLVLERLNGLDRTDSVRPGLTTAILCDRLQYVLCHVPHAYDRGDVT